MIRSAIPFPAEAAPVGVPTLWRTRPTYFGDHR